MTNLRYIVAGIVIIVIGLFAFSSVYTVHETKQALILEFGQPRDEETAPGLTQTGYWSSNQKAWLGRQNKPKGQWRP